MGHESPVILLSSPINYWQLQQCNGTVELEVLADTDTGHNQQFHRI